MRGNVVAVNRLFTSQNDLELLIDSLTFRLPFALTLHFREAPVVTKISGNVNRVRFESRYAKYPLTFNVSTQELQERQFLESWERLELLVPAENIRLYAALNYFHTACRLAFAGSTSWEFMGEALLNFSKVLEILFPSTRDAAREGLKRLGYIKKEVEHRFISVMALRNELDVAHVSLVAPERSELECLHRYTNKVEEYFREMLCG